MYYYFLWLRNKKKKMLGMAFKMVQLETISGGHGSIPPQTEPMVSKVSRCTIPGPFSGIPGSIPVE